MTLSKSSEKSRNTLDIHDEYGIIFIMLKPSKKLNTKAIPYEKCIAKKNHNGCTISVHQHCVSSGMVAEEIYNYDKINNPCRARMYPKNYAYIVSVHDIGKISDQFTYEIDSSILDEYDCNVYSELGNKTKSEYFGSCGITRFSHNEIGSMAYKKMFSKQKKISDIIKYHHGKYVSKKKFEIRGTEFEFDDSHMAQYKSIVDNLSKTFNRSETDEDFNEYFMLGLTMICDHIASNERYFPLVNMGIDEMRECARHAVHEIFKANTCELNKNMSFKSIFGFGMRNIQKDFCSYTNGNGMYIFEADAGIGKTEAAFYSIYDNMCKGNTDGMVFLLPTCAISNKIYERSTSFINTVTKNGIVNLVHGKSYVYNNELFDITDSSHTLSDWFGNNGHQMLPNFIVGTVDQGLTSVMKTKWCAMKLFSLCGKTVVIDEIHAYDTYTFELVCEMSKILHEMFGCTVIGMSASLPSSYRHHFLQYDNDRGAFPLIAGKGKLSQILHSIPNKSVNVSYGDIGDAIEKAISKAKQGLSVLWITNTVNSAQSLYSIMSAMVSDVEVGLIHSRNTTPNRCGNEDYWIETLGKDKSKRGDKPKILISTQVVEMSVNIDADFLISELSPLDSIVQRIGRLFRYVWTQRKVKTPEMMIYTEQKITDIDNKKRFENCVGNSIYVYSKYLLLKTFKFLKNKKVLNVSSDTQDGIEIIYSLSPIFDSGLEEEYYNEMMTDNEDSRLRASKCLITDESDYMPDEIMTRDIINGFQKTVLLVKKIRYDSKNSILIEPYDSDYRYKGKSGKLDSGISIDISSGKTNPFHRIILNNNTVTGVPLGRDCQHLEYDKPISKYYHEIPYVMLVDDDNNITYTDGTETGFKFLPKYGVVRNDIVESVTESRDTIETESNVLNGEW